VPEVYSSQMPVAGEDGQRNRPSAETRDMGSERAVIPEGLKDLSACIAVFDATSVLDLSVHLPGGTWMSLPPEPVSNAVHQSEDQQAQATYGP
jgi:hypothetical protein